MALNIVIKRIYDDPSPDDGTRVLVDRLWPRGVSKADAAVDHWARNLAPSTELRRWLHEDSSRFEAFAERYRAELRENRDAVDALLTMIDQRRRLTLLTSVKDTERNHATVLKDVLEARASAV